MGRFVTVAIVSVLLASDGGLQTKKKWNTPLPDSVVDFAVGHLIACAGDAFFRDRMYFEGGEGHPYGEPNPERYTTVWYVRYANGIERRFGVLVNADGSLASEVSLPLCADRPEACEPRLDETTAIATAESVLNETFTRNPVALLTYEHAPFDCYAWYFEAGAVAEADWHRFITAKISDVDGSVIYLGRAQEWRKFPRITLTEQLKNQAADGSSQQNAFSPDEENLLVDRAEAKEIAENALGDRYCGAYLDLSIKYEPPPCDCVAWLVTTAGTYTGDGWTRDGEARINADDGSIIRIYRWEEWKPPK
jgi:hypothetical protein